VINLGRAGIAVRSLSLETTPLEALFLGLTDADPSESTIDSRSQLVQATP
jgi:hypothetical protein